MSRKRDRKREEIKGTAALQRAQAAHEARRDRGVWTQVSDETLEKFLASMRRRIAESKRRGERETPRRSLEGRFFCTTFNPPASWLRETERRMRAAHARKTESDSSASHEENEDA